jgi:hypothetical protein
MYHPLFLPLDLLSPQLWSPHQREVEDINLPQFLVVKKTEILNLKILFLSHEQHTQDK